MRCEGGASGFCLPGETETTFVPTSIYEELEVSTQSLGSMFPKPRCIQVVTEGIEGPA